MSFIEQGGGATIEYNPVCWFEIYVQDMEQARRFYEAVLKALRDRLLSRLVVGACPIVSSEAGLESARRTPEMAPNAHVRTV